jgi:ribosome-associated translation inhibitor RaiA
MEISIQTSGLRLSTGERESVRKHVRERIEETFARIKRRIMRVSVHIEDVNGPRGGQDKHCVVKVSLGGKTAALAQGNDRNPFALINRVSACAAAVTLKRLKRRRDVTTIRKMDDPFPDNAL